MIRLFTAIAVPDEIAAALAPRQKGLLEARWRRADSLHITLRFFGSLSEDRGDDVDAELSIIAGQGFDLSLQGVGVFGEGADVHAVWAGVAPSEPLALLAKRCERAARRAGVAYERRAYRPHVTLAYLRNAAPAKVGAWVQRHSLLRSEPFRVRRFGLYSSWPSDDGSIYSLERAYSLS